MYGYSYPTTTDVVFQLSNDVPLPVDQENCKELVFEKMGTLRKAASATLTGKKYRDRRIREENHMTLKRENKYTRSSLQGGLNGPS